MGNTDINEMNKVITEYIEKFITESQYVSKIIDVKHYGGSLVIIYENRTRAKITASMWQPEQVITDNVYSRPECIFNYCSNPTDCKFRDKCLYPK